MSLFDDKGLKLCFDGCVVCVLFWFFFLFLFMYVCVCVCFYSLFRFCVRKLIEKRKQKTKKKKPKNTEKKVIKHINTTEKAVSDCGDYK